MIQDVDETLKRLLSSELSRIPGCPIRDLEQISFDAPASAEAVQDGEAHLNLYLYDVRENIELRDESFRSIRMEKDGLASRKRAPVRLNLSYLVTVYAGEHTATEHLLLSHVLGVLLRNLTAPAEHLAGIFDGQGSNVLSMDVAQPDHQSFSDPAALWQALGGRLRPALCLKVGAPFDPFESKWTKLVREAVVSLAPAPPPGPAGNASGPSPGRSHGPQNLARPPIGTAGIVLRQEDEQPLPGVSVRAQNSREQTITDERGIFRLTLPLGAQTLDFSLRGYRRQQEVITVRGGATENLEPIVVALHLATDAELASEEAARLEALWGEAGSGSTAINGSGGQLDNGHAHRVSLAGRLRFADGRPAAYIPVRVGRQTTVTDEEGVYCFLDLPPDEQRIMASVPGRGEIEVISRAGTATLELAVSALTAPETPEAQTTSTGGKDGPETSPAPPAEGRHKGGHKP